MKTVFIKRYKIQKHSGQVVLTIPHAFVKEFGLKAGQFLDVFQAGDALIVSKPVTVAAKDE